MRTTWVVVHTVRTLGSDFDTGSVFPAVFPCDTGHKMSLDNWICGSDVRNGIRHGDLDLAVIILAGAISYI